LIDIINFGLGNLLSIQRMIEKVGGKSRIVSSGVDLESSEKLILPGVGHFAEGARALRAAGLWQPLIAKVRDTSTPILGICLGMQLLCMHSEEGDIDGLGLIDARVEKFTFPDQPSLKVPHMGWNTLRTTRENPLLPMNEQECRFYFVHSYKVIPYNPDISISQCNYGGEFCAAFQERNVFGVQFHPEKSHRFGMALIKRFVEL
jgi:glutamine amidotransferase